MKKALLALALISSSALAVTPPAPTPTYPSGPSIIIQGNTGFTIARGVSDQGGPTLLCPPSIQDAKYLMFVSSTVCTLYMGLNETVNYTAVSPQEYLDTAFTSEKYEVMGVSPMYIRNQMAAVIYYRTKPASN